MPFDKDKIKQELTLEEIKSILHSLGSNDPKIIGNNLAFQTVCHSGHKHKLFYYPNSYSFHCYTDCGETFDIFDLVIRVNKQRGHDYSFYESVQYIVDLTGRNYQLNHFFKNDSYLVDDLDWLNKFQKKPQKDIVLPSYSESVLDVFLHLPHESWLDEGISYQATQKYGISYYVKDNAIIMPVRDYNGRLVGIRRRSLELDEIAAGKKYMPVTVGGKQYSYPALFNLYGLFENKDTIKRLKKCLIVEAEKSVLKVDSMYPGNNFTVATCNSNLSSWQRDTLLNLGIEEVMIGFDKEFDDPLSDEAEKYKHKLLKLAQMFTPYVRTYIIWDQNGYLNEKDAPCDKGQTVFEKLLMEKYEVKTMEGEEN